MRSIQLEQRLFDLAAPIAADMGLDLVCVRVKGEEAGQTVVIMAEDQATKGLGLEQCAELSKSLSALFDVEDPIQGRYRLEVSSPGIDRPLVKLEDFETYKGLEARMETQKPTESGQKRFRGRLMGLKGEQITVETEHGIAEIPFSALAKAQLVMSDELIKATQRKQD